MSASTDSTATTAPVDSTLTSSTTSPSAVLSLSYAPASVVEASPAPDMSAEERQHYQAILDAQGEKGMREWFIQNYEKESVKNWDRFYKKNADRFYKDRHYLTNEFKELSDLLDADRRARGESLPEGRGSEEQGKEENESSQQSTENGEAAAFASSPSPASASPPAPMLPITEPTATPGPNQRRLLEVGCGVGNALFPLLRLHPDLFFYGMDCSKNAIQVVQNHVDYLSSNRCAAWVIDVVTDEFPEVLRTDHLDFATLIFVLSAIHPTKMLEVLKKVHAALKKEEGVLFIRDYALYDLAQLRFAKTSKLGSNWYVRQDGTRSYFFTLDELSALLREAGFEVVEAQLVKKQVVNRKEKSEMSRRFVQIRAKAKRQTEEKQGEQSSSTDASTAASESTSAPSN